MKRSADRDMESPNKRPRNGDGNGNELRILIPSKIAGYIIGKGGSIITRLREENKASVSVPSYPGPERVIKISADDHGATLRVLSQILPMLKEGLEERQAAADRGAVEVRFLYRDANIGSIIGKGGATIQGLRETTNTQIKVYGECCPRSSDRVVAITGPVDQVLAAIQGITRVVLDNPIKGPPTMGSYDPLNYDAYGAHEYGGYGIGGGRGRERDFGGGGRSDSGNWRGFRDDPGNRHGGGRCYYNSGHRPNFASDEYPNDGVTTSQVTIPNDLAGSIIGTGGSRIRGIRQESGASISISDPAPGSKDRIITIIGQGSAIRHAQHLMQRSVMDHAPRGGK